MQYIKLIYYFLSILINSNRLHHLVHFNLIFSSSSSFSGVQELQLNQHLAVKRTTQKKRAKLNTIEITTYYVDIYTMCRRRRLPPLSPAVCIFYIYFMNSQYHMGRLQISTCEREQNVPFQLNLYMMTMMAYTSSSSFSPFVHQPRIHVCHSIF